MASNEARPVPSRMNLHHMKMRKKGAQQGYTLLKKKSDALSARFRGILHEVIIAKRSVMADLKEAFFALAKAYWAAGNFSDTVEESIRRPAVMLDVSTENVAGVRLPIFSIQMDPSVDVMGNIGVGSGGQVIITARESFQKALSAMIKLASLQTSFFTLDEEIKMTNRRVNALNNVVLPRINESVNYILRELDEMEREDFFRLKKVQKKNKELEDEEDKKAQMAAITDGVASMLEDLDDDVIF